MQVILLRLLYSLCGFVLIVSLSACGIAFKNGFLGSNPTDGGSTPSPNPQNTIQSRKDACYKDLSFERPIQRLTKTEYLNTVEKVTGYRNEAAASHIKDQSVFKFLNRPLDLTINEELLTFYKDYAREASKAYIENTVLKTSECPNKNWDCFFGVIKSKLPTLLRDPNSLAEDLSNFNALESEMKAEDEYQEDSDRLKGLMQTLLMHPKFLYKLETKSAASLNYIPTELAQKISFLLLGSPANSSVQNLASALLSANVEAQKSSLDTIINEVGISHFSKSFALNWLTAARITDTGFGMEEVALATRNKMLQEVETTFTEALRQDLRLPSLIDAKYIYADKELADFYELDSNTLKSNEFTKLEVNSDSPYGGLLSSGATMHATRASGDTEPLRRSLWLMNNILCSEFPEAPPGVDDLPSNFPPDGTQSTKRERIEANRTFSDGCKSCHMAMDPLGFSLESLDNQGKFRSTIENKAIDVSGDFQPSLVESPVSFNTLNEFKGLVANSPYYHKCFIKNMIEYITAHPLQEEHKCLVESVYEQAEQEQLKIKSILQILLSSPVFLSIDRNL